MKAIELTQKDQIRYDQFVIGNPLGTIHQLWDWGVFQAAAARRDRFRVFALVDDRENILASALIIRQRLPFKKSWLYCPRGPLLDYSKPEQAEILFTKIAQVAKEENALFLRIDPAMELGDAPGLSGAQNFFKKLKFRPAHAHYQPESTLIVDLQKDEEEILKQMKPKGRYNIKVAQKHGVTIHLSDGNDADVKTFYELFAKTTARDKFSGHPLDYYKNMLRVFGFNKAKLYIAKFGEKAAAAAIITYYTDTATYYFGASSDEHRNVMAPYLLHWKIMTDAKAEGFKFYDFFGIAPENKPNHPWAKVTDFKLKFGGRRVNYIPAQELVYSAFWYALVKIAKRLRKFIP